MYDFSSVIVASKDEQIRAWSIEQSIDHLREIDVPYQDVIVLSKMIEDFIRNGDINGMIQEVVKEGYTEGRFEVKEVVERWFTNVDLDDLFRAKGWIKTEPEEG